MRTCTRARTRSPRSPRQQASCSAIRPSTSVSAASPRRSVGRVAWAPSGSGRWRTADTSRAPLSGSCSSHGERVVRVATRLMAGERRSGRERGKSDRIDAIAVARAALREGLERLPVAELAGVELDIRLLVDHRDRLVRMRTALNNDLLWHLHDLWPELAFPGCALFSRSGPTRIARRLARAEQTARVRIARDELRHMRELSHTINALEAEISELVAASRAAVARRARLRALDRRQADRRDRRRPAASLLTPSSPAPAASRRSPSAPATPTATASTAAATAKSTPPSTASPSPAPAATPKPAPTSPARPPKARPTTKPCAASNATSPAASGTSSNTPHPLGGTPPSPSIS